MGWYRQNEAILFPHFVLLFSSCLLLLLFVCFSMLLKLLKWTPEFSQNGSCLCIDLQVLTFVRECRLGSPALIYWEHHSLPINVILGAEVIKKWAYLPPDQYSLTRNLKKRDKIWKEPDSLNHLIEIHLLGIYIVLFREWERNSIGVYLLKQSSLPYYPIPGPTETFS